MDTAATTVTRSIHGDVLISWSQQVRVRYFSHKRGAETLEGWNRDAKILGMPEAPRYERKVL